MVDRVGQRFGDYRLLSLLGEGTFGDVYFSEHIYQKAPAAVKVFKNKLTPDKFKDFLNEVRTVLLKHPNIIQILDFGIEEELPFLVMDYAPNGTLVQKHPRGTQLPLATTLSYAKQIAAGLQYAHDNRRIHRDIKPENILFGVNNEVLISDFGLAVVAHNPHSQRAADKNGTPLYMAPEQWQGKPLPATDQYALGIMVYEWLCGECPFEGNSLQLMYQHIHEAPASLHSKVPTISLEVEQAVMKALAKEPKERFTSIQAFATALEQASHSPQPNFIAAPSSKPVTSPASQPLEMHSRLPDLNTLYKEGVKARVQGDLERTALLWQQILDRDPQFQFGTLALQMKKLSEELVPWRMKRLRDQAEQAHALGEWEREIGAWQALLRLEPNNDETRARKALAEQHQKYAWMYEIASQFVQEKAFSEATIQLEMLWQEDPEYGDPAGLAQKVRIVRLKESYKGTISLSGSSAVNIKLGSIVQKGNAISGKLFILKHNKEYPTSFNGSINKEGGLVFTAEKAEENAELRFSGKIHSDGHLAGSYGFPEEISRETGIWEVS